jgi:hypothetical protein
MRSFYYRIGNESGITLSARRPNLQPLLIAACPADLPSRTLASPLSTAPVLRIQLRTAERLMRERLAESHLLYPRLKGSDEAAPSFFGCCAHQYIGTCTALSQRTHLVFLVTSDCHCCPMDPCLVNAENSPACPDDKQVRIYLQI